MKKKSEEMLNEIIDRTSETIMKRLIGEVAGIVHEEVTDLVYAMASAALEVVGQSCGKCECQEENKEKGPKKSIEKDKPVSFEIHAHGITLGAEDRLRLSRLICDFLKNIEDDEVEEEDESVEEDAESGEEDEEQELFPNLAEHVTITIDDRGKASIKRRAIKIAEGTFEEESEED